MIQMHSARIHDVVELASERDAIRRLRIEATNAWGEYDSEYFYRYGTQELGLFPNLEDVDVLVGGRLQAWTNFLVEDVPGGICGRAVKYVRVVDAKTGEWTDAETAGPYADYMDSGGGERPEDFTRIPPWDEDDEDAKDRIEDMKRLQMPRPRINLDY